MTFAYWMKQSLTVRGASKFSLALPPSDSLVMAHGYLSEVYLLRRELSEAVEQYDQAVGLADKLGLGSLKARLVEELAGKLRGTSDSPATWTLASLQSLRAGGP